jgi:hypothetical protein
MIKITKHVQITFEGESVSLLGSMAEICRIKLAEDRARLTHIEGTGRGGEIDKLLQTIFEL